jgi:RNA polymerase sigma-70 factor (ECF subfamily)
VRFRAPASASENIKEETDDSEIKESQIEHFYKAVQKLEK